MVDVKCVMVNDSLRVSGVKAFFNVYPSPPPTSGRVIATVLETPKELTAENVPWPSGHLKNSAFVGKYPLPIQEIFRRICVDSEYLIKLNALQESRATIGGEWQPSTDIKTSLEEVSREERRRENSWEKKMQKTAANAFLRIPDYARVTEEQTLMVHPTLKEVLILSTSSVAQVPYCECFKIVTRLHLVSLSETETQIENEMSVEWSQSCWLRGKIEASCESEWQETIKDMQQVLGNILKGEQVLVSARRRSLPAPLVSSDSTPALQLLAASASGIASFVSRWHNHASVVILIGLIIRLILLLTYLIQRLDQIELTLINLPRTNQ